MIVDLKFMLIPYKFTYFSGTLLFMAYWLYFWIKFKDNRRQMLLFGVIFAVLGPVSGVLWFTADWWYPDTILGYKTGIEDVLLGFSHGGISSVIFLLFFREKHDLKLKINIFRGIILFSLVMLITVIVFLFFNINSFYANCIGIATGMIYVFAQRRDLLFISFLSGIMMMIFSVPVYALLSFLSPGWVETAWMLDNLSGIVWMGAPIEDLAWYFFVGASISIMYPYFTGIRYEYKAKSSYLSADV